MTPIILVCASTGLCACVVSSKSAPSSKPRAKSTSGLHSYTPATVTTNKTTSAPMGSSNGRRNASSISGSVLAKWDPREGYIPNSMPGKYEEVIKEGLCLSQC